MSAIRWHQPTVGWWAVFFLEQRGWEAVFHARASGEEVRAKGKTPEMARKALEKALCELPQPPARGRFGPEDSTCVWVNHKQEKILGFGTLRYIYRQGRMQMSRPRPESVPAWATPYEAPGRGLVTSRWVGGWEETNASRLKVLVRRKCKGDEDWRFLYGNCAGNPAQVMAVLQREYDISVEDFLYVVNPPQQ